MKLNQRLIITGFIMLVAATSAFALFRNFSKLKPSNTSLSMSSVSETTKKAISDNTIMVFSKSYCPFCKKAKSAIEGLNLKYGVMELDVSNQLITKLAALSTP